MVKDKQEKAEQAAEMKPRAFGRFELLREIGSGGMAEVFVARDRARQPPRDLLVIKRILPHLARDAHFVQLFLQEARLVALLRHPNVLPVFELGQVGDTHFITMPFVDGCTVKEILERSIAQSTALSPGKCCELAIQALRGLHYAHECRDEQGAQLQLVHRDISPPNLMLDRRGRVLLLDFGVATAREAPAAQPRQLPGKPAYMSPEQIRGESLDRRSDIFSLGIILYELLSATRLFERDNSAATLGAVCEERLPMLRERRPEVPAELAAIVHRALDRKKEQRFATAEEMADAIEELRPRLGLPRGERQLAGLVETSGHELSSPKNTTGGAR